VFGDRSLVMGVLDTASLQKVDILDRLLTYEPLALALSRGDEDFRLLVDSALSETYASDGFSALYRTWCGDMDDKTRAYFVWSTLSQ